MSVLVKSERAVGFKVKSRIGLAVLTAVLWVMLFTYMGSFLRTVRGAAANETPSLKVATQVASSLQVAHLEDPLPGDEDTGTVSEDQVG